MFDSALWIFSFVACVVLLIVVVHFLISLSDLECDFLNPMQLCRKLNPFLLPEYIGQGVMTLLFLLTGNWLALLLNVPMVAYHVQLYRNKSHRFDQTNILMPAVLGKRKREYYVKLAFYLLMFFFYLYKMVFALVAAFAGPSGITPGYTAGRFPAPVHA